jgi:hypothetical protein
LLLMCCLLFAAASVAPPGYTLQLYHMAPCKLLLVVLLTWLLAASGEAGWY